MQFDSVLTFTFILRLVWFLNSNSDDRSNHMAQRHPLPCCWVNHYPRATWHDSYRVVAWVFLKKKREIIVVLYVTSVYNQVIFT